MNSSTPPLPSHPPDASPHMPLPEMQAELRGAPFDLRVSALKI
jgi:hypothetical protein